MMWQFFLAHLAPLALDFIGHLFVGALFVLWWLTRYAGRLDEPLKAENIPLRTDDRWKVGSAAESQHPAYQGVSRRRRVPLALIALIIVGIVGTALPILTANLALHSPPDAKAPPAPAEVSGE